MGRMQLEGASGACLRKSKSAAQGPLVPSDCLEVAGRACSHGGCAPSLCLQETDAGVDDLMAQLEQLSAAK